MTSAVVGVRGSAIERPELPETVRSWPEWSDSLGFAGRDAVSFAAAWFEQRSEGRRRLVCSKDAEFDSGRLPVLNAEAVEWLDRYRRGEVEGAIRADGADGPVWVDPSTGEVVPNPPAGPGDLDRSYFVDSHSGESTYRTEAAPLDYRIVITPGTVGLRVTDPRDASDPPPFPEMFFDEEGNVIEPAAAITREPITEFSAKSRTRLVRRLLSIPWGEYLEPGERIYVVTLTAAPADHLAVFSDHTDGYRALRSFQDRLSYATDRKARGFWKLEFQRRGAPHWHLVLIAPRRIGGRRLTEWISHAWWEAVGSGVESHLLAGTNVDVERSVQASDALRLALYFAGYSTTKDKEYQHKVPEEGWVDEKGSTGRFWGYFGVKPAEEEVRISREDLVEVKRLLRARERSQRVLVDPSDESTVDRNRSASWAAKGHRVDELGRFRLPLTKNCRVLRTVHGLDRSGPNPECGPSLTRWRTVRRRRRTSSLTGVIAGCTSYVNNGPDLAVQIARAIALTRDQEPWPRGRRRPLP